MLAVNVDVLTKEDGAFTANVSPLLNEHACEQCYHYCAVQRKAFFILWRFFNFIALQV